MVLLPLIFLCILDHIFGCWHLTLRAKACFRWGWGGVGVGGVCGVCGGTWWRAPRSWPRPLVAANACGLTVHARRPAIVDQKVKVKVETRKWKQQSVQKTSLTDIHSGSFANATFCQSTWEQHIVIYLILAVNKVVFVNYCCEDTGDWTAVLSRAIFLLPSASQAASYWASNTLCIWASTFYSGNPFSCKILLLRERI